MRIRTFSLKNIFKVVYGAVYRLANRLLVYPPFVVFRGVVISYHRRQVIQLLESWAGQMHGKVLDVGVGDWKIPRRLLQGRCEYIGTDCYQHPNIDVVSDIHHLTDVFAENSYDYILCTEVLEHTQRPWLVMRQMHALLKPGGMLLMTTPFDYPLHGNQHVTDYWRFTSDGLRSLLVEEAGFSQVKITPYGAVRRPYGYSVEARK